MFAGQRFAIAASLMVACLAVFAIYAHGVTRRSGDLSIPKNSLTPGETRNVTVGDVCNGTSAGPASSACFVDAAGIPRIWHQRYAPQRL